MQATFFGINLKICEFLMDQDINCLTSTLYGVILGQWLHELAQLSRRQMQSVYTVFGQLSSIPKGNNSTFCQN